MRRMSATCPWLLLAAGLEIGLSACIDDGLSGLPDRAMITAGRARGAISLLPQRPEAPGGWAVSAAASRLGEVAVPVAGLDGVLAEVAAGHAVVIGQGVHAPAVATGYDLRAGTMTVLGGDGRSGAQPLARWRRHWEAGGLWAVAVMLPGELPVAGDQESYLRAAARVEQAASPWEAVLVYDAGLARWPDNAGALSGLGNSLFHLGDAKGAAAAFAAAIERSNDASERERIRHLAADAIGTGVAAQPVSATEKSLSDPGQ